MSNPTYPKYQAPSAPTSFIFSDGSRLNAYDGVLQATDDKQAAELKAARDKCNISDWQPKQELKPQQQAPNPPQPTQQTGQQSKSQ